MSSARRTPRYVSVIEAIDAGKPTPPGASGSYGPQLMGPHPALGPSGIGRSRPATVLEIHPELALTAPASPAYTAGPDRRRAVPVARRPWEIVILSAAPGVAPRRVAIARWQVRVLLAGLGTVTLLAAGLVAAVVFAVRSPDEFVRRGTVDLLRAELAASRDSLGGAKAEVERQAAVIAAATASGVAAGAAVPVTSRPAAGERRPPVRGLATRPGSKRASRDGSMDGVSRMIGELPVIGSLVSRFSSARRHPVLRVTRPHLGVDVAAPRGTRVSAPAPGRVKFVGRRLGFGLVVELEHGDGVTTRYAHLRSSAVQQGERVGKGEAIAAVGTSGITTGPHLHYEVLVNGRQVDPLRFRFAGSEAAPASPGMPAGVAPITPAPVGSGLRDESASPGGLLP